MADEVSLSAHTNACGDNPSPERARVFQRRCPLPQGSRAPQCASERGWMRWWSRGAAGFDQVAIQCGVLARPVAPGDVGREAGQLQFSPRRLVMEGEARTSERGREIFGCDRSEREA